MSESNSTQETIWSEDSVFNGGSVTFDNGLAVFSENGTPVTSGDGVPVGKYYATVASQNKNECYSILRDGEVVAAALNGTARYDFEVNDEKIELNLKTEKTVTTGGGESISVDLEWLADSSVLYDNGKYYMAVASNWGSEFGKGKQIWQIYEANNLTDFSERSKMKAYCVMSLEEFAATPGVEAYDQLGQWAPELQKFGDYFYLTTTYICTAHGVANDRDSGGNRPLGKGMTHRAQAIFRSKSPTSGWEVWCKHIDTPMTGENTTWDTIDGFIYYEDEKPYLIVGHDWPSQPADMNGSFEYIQLKDDLSDIADGAQWKKMFQSHDVAIYKKSGTCDGPHLYKNSKGELMMLWSNHENGYNVSLSKSSNGRLDGEWGSTKYVYNRDIKGMNIDGSSGGHPGLVQTPEGQLYLTFHLNQVESDKRKIPHMVAVRETANGYLEWGINEDLMQIVVDSGDSKEVDLVKNGSFDTYTASFTIMKDGMPTGKYLGFRMITSNRRSTTLLINSKGMFKVGNGKETSFEMPNTDEIVVTITCLPDETPKVYLNGVLNEAMTDALENVYAEGVTLSTLQLTLQGSNTTALIKDWSFTSGVTNVPFFNGVVEENTTSSTTTAGSEVLLPPDTFE